MAELLAGLTHRWRVHDRHEPSRVAHEQPVEERFVCVLELGQIDVPLEIGDLRLELGERAADLGVLVIDAFGEQPEQAELFALGFSEGGGFVEPRLVEQIGTAGKRHPHRA